MAGTAQMAMPASGDQTGSLPAATSDGEHAGHGQPDHEHGAGEAVVEQDPDLVLGVGVEERRDEDRGDDEGQADQHQAARRRVDVERTSAPQRGVAPQPPPDDGDQDRPRRARDRARS